MISIIKSRLPVDSDADFTYANVTHEGTFLQQSEVKTDANGNKYVEVSSNTFSVFRYKLTNDKYVAPSTGGPGSSSSVSTIKRKPVVTLRKNN